jgi:hypothetical protein
VGDFCVGKVQEIDRIRKINEYTMIPPTDKEINGMVFELYGLSEEERGGNFGI